MKNLLFEELLIVSDREKAARRIQFAPGLTVIRGKNSTGKSCILKSLYSCLGATPIRQHPRWISAHPIYLLRFRVENSRFSVLRTTSEFAFFDENDRLLKVCRSITNEVTPFISELLDFGLLLTDNRGVTRPAPPQYLFLPFYLDQDDGWGSSAVSFKGLQMFPKWRKPTLEYHAGVRGNDFYNAKARLERELIVLEEKQREYEALRSAQERVISQMPEGVFNMDPSTFQQEIQTLVDRSSALFATEQRFKAELSAARNERAILIDQLEIASMSKRELRADYRHATEHLTGEDVDCPLCGASYENSFAERFDLAKDEDRITELLLELNAELAKTDTRIEALNAEFLKNRGHLIGIQQVLAERKGEFFFKDIIVSESKKEVRGAFDTGIKSYLQEIGLSSQQVVALENELDRLDNKDHRSEVRTFFGNKMAQLLGQLSVRTLPEKQYKDVFTPIRQTGSEGPRSILAYFLSLLYTKLQFNPSPFCPLVIDSPNQQAQDRESLTAMLRVLFSESPPQQQIILGVEDDLGLEYEGSTIDLTEKFGVLRQAEYSSCLKDVEPFLDRVLLR